MPDASDSELIARFKRGDRAAFDALVNLYLARVAAVARGFLRDSHEAMDVAQEVFVAAFHALREWREEGQLFSWLYRTTIHLCSKRFRNRLRPTTAADLEEAAGHALSPADAAAERADRARIVEEALATLTDRQREVFVACHGQGVPLAEVAGRLGISIGTAKSHLHRALCTLRDNCRLKGLL
jgi:RNA polymerase sigma-70 factor (ECF subfamily)